MFVARRIVAQVILGDNRDVRSGIVLLEAVGLPAEQRFDGWHELVLKEFSVPSAVDVAADNEGSDEAPPRNAPVDMECARVAVDAHRLGFLTEERPLSVVPRVVFEFSRHERGVCTNEHADPVAALGVEHVAVRLTEAEVPWLEWDASGARLEIGRLVEVAAGGGVVDVEVISDDPATLAVSCAFLDDLLVCGFGDGALVAAVARPPFDAVVGDDVGDGASLDGVAAVGDLLDDGAVGVAVGVVRKHESTACDGSY